MTNVIGQSLKIFLMGTLILLLLILGCGSSEESAKEDTSEDVRDFSGTWRINEEWTGCDNSLMIEYIAVITQEDGAAQLTIGDNTLTCSVNGDELLCSGELQVSSGNAYRDFEEIIILFQDDKQLQGTGNWILYGGESGSCSGNSLFYLSPDSTMDFSGTWDIREKWQGCNRAGIVDYTIDIKQNGTEATLFIYNRSLDCMFDETELYCTGERYYENGTYDEYSEYILWFDEEGQINGEGTWIYHGTENSDCSGTSVLYADDSNSDDLDEINFEGVYKFFLNIEDCRGLQAAQEAGTYVIIQDGINATFQSIGDPQIHLNCQVIRGELQCAGDIIASSDSNSVWEIEQVTFSYDSRNDLAGVSTGVVYEEDGSECRGIYSLSTVSPVSEPAASFNGAWNINEALLGCTTSVTSDYQIEIIEEDGRATITIQGEIFDCTIENNELICGGIFNGGSGVGFEYSEYRLWFNEHNLLDGIARWTLYQGDNASCIGNSTLSGTPAVSSGESLTDAFAIQMNRYLSFDCLQTGQNYSGGN